MTSFLNPRRLAGLALPVALLLGACSGSGGHPAAAPSTAPSPNSHADIPLYHPGDVTVDKAGPYQVSRLIDSATLEVDRGPAGGLTTVRLLGVVTPDGDVDHPGCFTPQATAQAHQLLDGQKVGIVGDSRQGPRDDAGRLLAYVWLDNGRMANDLLVEGGFAREATGAPAYVYRDVFARSEQLARQTNRGLWAADTCAGNITRVAS